MTVIKSDRWPHTSREEVPFTRSDVFALLKRGQSYNLSPGIPVFDTILSDLTINRRSVQDKLQDTVSFFDYITSSADRAAMLAGNSLNGHSSDLLWAIGEVARAGRHLDVYGTLNLDSQVLVENVSGFGMSMAPNSKLRVPVEGAPRPLVFRNCDNLLLNEVRMIGERIDSTNALSIENSSNVRIYEPWLENFLGIGLTISQATSSPIAATDFVFDAATRTISSPSVQMDLFPVGTLIHPIRTRKNNYIRKIAAVSAHSITVEEYLVDEDAAGLSVELCICAPCNNILIYGGTYLDCSVAGTNQFPKALSDGYTQIGGYFRRCARIDGVPVSGSGAIKAGQFTTNAYVGGFDIADCGTGLGLGAHESLRVGAGSITNCDQHAIAVSMSHHRLFDGSTTQPSLSNLDIEVGQIIMTPEFAKTASASYAALSLNGFAKDGGPVKFHDGYVRGWRGQPWAVYYSLVKMPGVSFEDIKFEDCNGFGFVLAATATATTSAGTNVLSSVNDGLGGPPLGWYPTAGVTEDTGTYFPADTEILSITQLGTITLSQPAEDTGTFLFTNATGSVSALGDIVSGDYDVTNIPIAGWIENDLVNGTGIPVGTLALTITRTTATMTTTKNALLSSTIPIHSDYPERPVWKNLINIVNPIESTGDINSTTALTNIPLDDWDRLRDGWYAVATGIPIGATITKTTAGNATLSSAATATTVGVAIVFAPNQRASFKGYDFEVDNVTLDGGGEYVATLAGGGTVRNSRLWNSNVGHIANRGPIIPLDGKPYKLYNNEVDNKTYGSVAFMVDNTTYSNIDDHGNKLIQASIRGAAVPTSMPGSFGSVSFGGRRVSMGSGPPVSGTWTEGSIVWNNGLLVDDVVYWRCTVSGSPGTWTASNIFASVGIGTAAPQGPLHVLVSGTAGTPSTPTGYGLIFQRSGAAGATSGVGIIAGNTGNSAISFGDTDAFIRGQIIYSHATDSMAIATAASNRLTVSSAGRVAIGTHTPTAWLHLPAGLATANSAPIKLTAGTLLSTPEDGALEYDGTHVYFTVGSTRTQIL